MKTQESWYPLVMAGLLIAAFFIPARALDGPTGDTGNATVTCAGSAGTPVLLRPTAAPYLLTEAVVAYNPSTTCVRVGGVGVTASTGVPIGDGCDGGMFYAAEARRTWCISEAVGTVDVQILYGSR